MTTSTGTSCHLPTRMVIPTPSLMTDSGGRQDPHKKVMEDTVLELTLTGTGTSTGERLGLDTIHVMKLGQEPRPSLSQR